MEEGPLNDASLDMSESTLAKSGQPPRKRRRPALSCEQCRKRKIKCDRNYPCNHCTASKGSKCTYSSDNAAAHALETTGATAPSQGAAFPSRPKKNPSSIASSTHPSSDATSPRAFSLSEGTRSSYHSPNTETDYDEGTSRKALLERIVALEGKLAKSKEEPKPANELKDCEDLNLYDLAHAHLTPDTYEGKALKGTVSKTRYFGPSSWMYSFGTFDRVSCINVDGGGKTLEYTRSAHGNDVHDLLDKCKSLGRAAKANPHKQWVLDSNYRNSIPPREVADKLVNLYFRTSESIHRILHIPTFQREYAQYWENRPAASTVFMMKMMLVMCIGAAFYQEPDTERFHSQALQWIYAAQAWLSTPFEKGRLHVSGVQIYCLVLVARSDHAVAGDLIWISAGALLRIAFQMGFHRDPKYLPAMPQVHAELRRRLWLTIIELGVQSALDSGMPALISVHDYDTELPANIDDSDLDEHSKETVIGHPPEVYTQASLQLMLSTSLRSRIEVINHANSVGKEPSYDEVLALDAQLTKALKANIALVSRINAGSRSDSAPPVSQLNSNILDQFVRRFLLNIHRGFAAKASADPKYYFSRKVCLDCSLTILSYPSTNSRETGAGPGYHDDYSWLKFMSGGFQKGFIVHAAMVIFAELLTQIEEDGAGSSSSAREPLKQALRDIIALAAERIRVVENNVKGHVFINIVLAQVEAIERGENTEMVAMEAARKSLLFCYDLLRERISKSISAEEYAAIVDHTGPKIDNTTKGKDLATATGEINSTDMSIASRNPPPVPMAITPGFGPGFSFAFGKGMGMTSMQDWGADFGMQDWNSSGGSGDNDFMMSDSWLLPGWDDGTIF